MANRLIDTFVEDGSCDAVGALAALLPSMVMGELLGYHPDLVPVCRALTDDHMRKTSPGGRRATRRAQL